MNVLPDEALEPLSELVLSHRPLEVLSAALTLSQHNVATVDTFDMVSRLLKYPDPQMVDSAAFVLADLAYNNEVPQDDIHLVMSVAAATRKALLSENQPRSANLHIVMSRIPNFVAIVRQELSNWNELDMNTLIDFSVSNPSLAQHASPPFHISE